MTKIVYAYEGPPINRRDGSLGTLDSLQTSGETLKVPLFSSWQSMMTVPHDREILLKTNTGVVSAYYDKGSGWSETLEGRDYEGPCWVCYDGAFEIEIEETPIGELCKATGWMEMPN